VARFAFSGSAWLDPDDLAPAARMGSFSPSVDLPMSAGRELQLASLETTAAPAPTTRPVQAPIASDVQTAWQTTIVSAVAPAATELTPRDPDTRYKLVLDIQQQLRRAGCYWGRMDGSWGYATKDAMKEFINRVNARLPLDQPDYVQLSLIQSHSGETCGLVVATQNNSRSGAGATTLLLFKPVLTMSTSSDPVPGRMALGAPAPTSRDLQPEAPVTSGAAPSGSATAVLDPSLVKPPPVAAMPKAKHRSSSSDRRRGGQDQRRFAGNGRVGPGTPRYNLMLSLGGLY
jgi:hypothetical protein